MQQEEELNKRENELLVTESDFYRTKALVDFLGQYQSSTGVTDMFNMLKETTDADVQRLQKPTFVEHHSSQPQTLDEFLAQHGSISSGENL